MTVYLARDGEELGECDQQDLVQLAREGQVEPTDHYWHDGMEEWRLLGDLLEPEIWMTPTPEKRVLKPTRVPEPPSPRPKLRAPERTVRITTEPPPPAAEGTAYRDPREYLRRRKRRPPPRSEPVLSTRARTIAILSVIVLLFIGAGSYVFFAIRANRETRATTLFPKSEATPVPLSADAVRDKASADLREKIGRLPASPAPPLNRFFYDVKVNMHKTLSPRTPWWVEIRGGENGIEPETQKTLTRTDFILTAEYRDGEWVFKHYRASISDMIKEQTAEIDENDQTPVPPSIVGMMGLKMPPRG